ncbi:FK506-binding protein 4 [Apostichopus japonicus]|uniref:FK506-binding protein 4 n=1 Tax=Stichopus japonicus TaxID=307972 RepID=A0A2G8JKP1_STIJA|nr:FK506-binding protein 4 [Apostichopus japonicus]
MIWAINNLTEDVPGFVVSPSHFYNRDDVAPWRGVDREIRIKEHLTLAALECRPWKYNGEPNPAACLLLKIDNNDHVICTLEKGSTPQQNLDLVLQQRETVTFTVEGTGIVYITGYSLGDNVNIQTNPLVQQEVAGDSLSGYDDEHEVSSDTDYYSKEGNSNKIQEIKNEVVISSDFHEGDEEEWEEEEGRRRRRRRRRKTISLAMCMI